MIQLAGTVVLLDIEGTVAPVTFVYEVMFPFVRQHVGQFVQSNWQQPDVQQAIAMVATDLGHASAEHWLTGDEPQSNQQRICSAVHEMMDRDAKLPGLKQLQGLIWRSGFESGELVADLFPDVLRNLRRWKDRGLLLYIYSSGSVEAQQLFFGHTTAGNLLELFSGYFDTTTGNKKQASSYQTIANQLGQPPGEIIFISDSLPELDAARQAEMQTVWRTDERQSTPHYVIDSFEEIEIQTG